MITPVSAPVLYLSAIAFATPLQCVRVGVILPAMEVEAVVFQPIFNPSDHIVTPLETASKTASKIAFDL
jgi:hypothetical protein